MSQSIRYPGRGCLLPIAFVAREPIPLRWGVSSRGTRSSDVYSIKGLDQALNRIAQECR
jgi:hypothetical protein